MAVTRIPNAEQDGTSANDPRLDLSVAEIDLPVRTVNGLEEQRIFTVRDLLACTPERLLSIPGFGEKTLRSIYRALAKIGFHR